MQYFKNKSANTFVLKSYSTEDADKYSIKVKDLKKLASQDSTEPNLWHSYGSYEQGNTINIFLEYTDYGTLEQYLQANVPPARGEDIIESWDQVLRIIRALARLHEVRRSDSRDMPGIKW
jgi:hypothetical protein